jgi:hypothetical protein
MRELTAVCLVVAACGGGKQDVVIADAGPDAFVDLNPDAREPVLSCAANPEPTQAPAMVTIAGQAGDVNIQTMMLEPVEGAELRMFKNGDPTALGTTISSANGGWSFTLATGGVPIDGYLEGELAGHRSLRLYTPQPLSASIGSVPALLLANSTFNLLIAISGVQQDPANGTLVLLSTDCALVPLAGAELSLKRGDVELITPDNSQAQNGALFVFDLTPGEAVVSGTFNGTPLRPHTIEIVAGTNTATSVTPGFLVAP